MTPDEASRRIRKAARKNRRSVFDQVTWELWGNVFHQGSVWQVTATTVPFFAAILRDGPDAPRLKEFLINYLHNLALGYPEDLFPDFPNPEVEFAAVSDTEEPGGEPDYGAADNRYLIWVRDSYEAVERHIDDVVPYVDSDSDDVWAAAIAMCASFPRCAERTAPVLRRIAEDGGQRGANAALSLAVLVGAEVRSVAESIAASPDRHTAILGACAAVLSEPDDVSPEVISLLTAPLDELSKERSAHAFSLSSLIGRCLMRLGPEHRDRAATGISKQLIGANALESVSLTNSLLMLVFQGEPPADAGELTPTQRRAIEAIRDHGAFKVSAGIFANYASLLRDWKLPDSADGIDAWLGGDQQDNSLNRSVEKDDDD